MLKKIYNYLKDINDEDKKAKDTKKCVIKRKLKFKDYEKYLKASQVENKVNYKEKNKSDIDSVKEDKKEFLKSKQY